MEHSRGHDRISVSGTLNLLIVGGMILPRRNCNFMDDR